LRTLAIRVAANAVALWVAVRLVRDIHFPAAQGFPNGDWWKLAVVALIFAFINAYIRPIAKAVSVPARMMTLGLFSLALNAALLLLLAYLSTSLSLGFTIATFPPSLDLRVLIAALLGSLVISIVSLVLPA
jgi:putative membrane protein